MTPDFISDLYKFALGAIGLLTPMALVWWAIYNHIRQLKKEHQESIEEKVAAERVRIDALEAQAATFKPRTELQEEARLLAQQIELEKASRVIVTDKLASDIVDARMDHTRLATRFDAVVSDVAEIKVMTRAISDVVNQLRIDLASK